MEDFLWGLWNGISAWPLVVAQSQDMYTLPVALALYSTGQNQINFGFLLAGAVVVTLPAVLAFLGAQRMFTNEERGSGWLGR